MTQPRPWYEDFFAPEFWQVAQYEYTPERTGREVDYLASVLDAYAPGKRVLDLGCGTGRHAIGLAARGYQVVGLDVSAWALDRAAEAADAAGVEARWLRCDLLGGIPAEADGADAAICLQAFGLGADEQQVRFLREVRRSLVPGGLFVLDHSSVLPIVRHYAPEAAFETEGLRARFHRSYRTVAGRSAGRIEVDRDGAAPASLRDDVRLYQPAGIRALLSVSGFAIERVDADFAPGSDVTIESRYVQFLARTPSRAQVRQALDGHRDPVGAAEDLVERLDLRTSSDEVEFVRPALEHAMRAVFGRPDIADLARDYPLTDPFGGARCAPALSDHFGAALTPEMVTVGAGATGLLHALAVLGQPGPVLASADGHPDLPRWSALGGARVVSVDAGHEALPAEMHELRPALVVLDRPSITGEFASVQFVGRLAQQAYEVGALVVVDEAYATYAGPAASCVPLIARHPNLVVVRSMSKGYCCGGLRVGFALAGLRATARLREVALPLGAGGTSLAVVLGLLGQGDVFAALRERIAAVKPEVVAGLTGLGLRITPGADCLPWVTGAADQAARAALDRVAVRAKESPGASGRPVLKLAVPLSPERLEAFRARMPAVADR
jgi:histidinol-phosphate/aromatic aminotransferase/cobyric acid decarboxylase-like protein/ubiquinone/menaquinone biosynthesis C-methylase UbiE